MIWLLDCPLYEIPSEQLHHDIQYLNDLFTKRKNVPNGRDSYKIFVINLNFHFHSKIRDVAVLMNSSKIYIKTELYVITNTYGCKSDQKDKTSYFKRHGFIYIWNWESVFLNHK